MGALKLPETESIEELARFWDSQDLTDFEDQLEEVAEPIFENGGEVPPKGWSDPTKSRSFALPLCWPLDAPLSKMLRKGDHP